MSTKGAEMNLHAAHRARQIYSLSPHTPFCMTLPTLTDEALRIRVAELCPDRLRQVHGRWQYSDGSHWYNCKDNDPLADLNACAGFEARMTEKQRPIYVSKLENIVTKDLTGGWSWALLSASARDRCLAFVEVVGK